MDYDIEKYFGAGHWISRDGKIEVPIKSEEHAEVAPDVVEKYYNDEFIDMDPGLSLSDYSDFLLGKGWIVHRESNFLCNRLDNTTKDTIFLFAKKNNFKKITVEAPQKMKLIEEPPEMIYEGYVLKERRDYKFDLQQKFNEYNRDVFHNEIIIPVSLSWNSQMRRKLGLAKYDKRDLTQSNPPSGNVRIIMSSFFDMSDEQFRDVMIHEMIHAWQVQRFGYASHSVSEFVNKANEINNRNGTHITIVNDDPTLAPEQRLRNKTENIIIKTKKNGQKSIALLGKQILRAITLIDWQKYADVRKDYSSEAIESIKLYITTADQVWNIYRSLSSKIKFQFFGSSIENSMVTIDKIEKNSQLVQQLYP